MVRIPDDNGADSALFGLFGGWVYWRWLREQGAGMAAEGGYAILCSDKAEDPETGGMPAIYFFCGKPERMATIASFIGDKLG